MIKKIFKPAFLAMAVAFALPVSSYAAVNAVKIIDLDKKETVFLLEGHPTVSFSDDYLTITTDVDPTGVTFEAEQPYDFRFHEVQTTGVGSLVSGEASVNMSGDVISVANFEPNSPITISALNGMVAKKAVTDAAGFAEISLGDLAKGFYIFNSQQVNFKFLKK